MAIKPIRYIIESVRWLLGTPNVLTEYDDVVKVAIDPTSRGWMNANVMFRTVSIDMTLATTTADIFTSVESQADMLTIAYPYITEAGGAPTGNVWIKMDDPQGNTLVIGRIDVGDWWTTFDLNAPSVRTNPLHGLWVPKGWRLYFDVGTIDVGGVMKMEYVCIITPHGQGPPDVIQFTGRQS